MGTQMGVSFKIEKDIAVVTNSGSFSNRDVEKTLLALTKDQDYKPGIRILFIDRGSEYNPPKHGPKEAARILSLLVPKISDRIAIVVKKDVHFGIARMIQVYCEFYRVTFEVFREEQAARIWLGEDPNGK
ncbi:MAG: hypothetical protein GY706_07950 [Bacteroides sp.]|nr:hypothetical protein [Bacteroides sp.]